jgi:hypothetical protein
MDQRELIGEQEESLRSIIDTTLLQTWTCLPGIVQSYDPTTGLAVVQPSIIMQSLAVDSTGQTTPTRITPQPIPDIPVVFIGGGGMVFETTPANGDECLIIFASRCIDGWWKSGGVKPQPVLRHHTLSDGFAIVGPFSLPNLFTSLGPGMRLRKKDGTAFVELTPAGAVNILAPGGVTITGDLTVTGDVVADLAGSTFDGITFDTHKHTGVQTGGGVTGVPIA